MHPTAIPGADKLRLMSESARGEGGRVWVPKKKGDNARPEADPRDGALVLPRGEVPEVRQPRPARHRHARDLPGLPRPRHWASTASDAVYLDLTHIPAKTLDAKLAGVLEIYEKFVGDDPRHDPDEDLPRGALLDGRPVGRLRGGQGQHARRGLARRTRRRTSPASTRAARSTTSTTARNRLGANSLLSCIYGGHGRRARRWRATRRTTRRAPTPPRASSSTRRRSTGRSASPRSRR